MFKNIILANIDIHPVNFQNKMVVIITPMELVRTNIIIVQISNYLA